MPPRKARTGGGDHRGGEPRHGTPASPWGRPGTIAGKPSAEETTAEGPAAEAGRRERVGERDNLVRARKHVHSQGGSPGREGMTVAGLAPSLKEHGRRVKHARWAGTSHPPPGKRVAVPNPPGGGRKLGGPTVGDRGRPHAGRQGRQAPGAPPFSASSFGCRPGRNAHQAVKRAPSDLQEGAPGVGERDGEKFVDRVPHDKVRREVSTRVQEGRGVPLSH